MFQIKARMLLVIETLNLIKFDHVMAQESILKTFDDFFFIKTPNPKGNDIHLNLILLYSKACTGIM